MYVHIVWCDYLHSVLMHPNNLTQVDSLNTVLLSDRAHHEKLCEELKLSYQQESANLKRHNEQQLTKLTDEIDSLKQHRTQVCGVCICVTVCICTHVCE